jgi:flagellar protein FlgJ
MNISAIASTSSPASVAELTAARSAPTNRKPLTGAALRSADPAQQREAVGQQFEAIMIRQMLSKTMSSMLGSESAGGGASANVYGDMLTDTFAQQLTAGSGLGLGRMLEKQLTPRGTPPADLAATVAKTNEAQP